MLSQPTVQLARNPTAEYVKRSLGPPFTHHKAAQRVMAAKQLSHYCLHGELTSNIDPLYCPSCAKRDGGGGAL